jgi:orotidine-5'-phosphate decarboxylase
MTSTTPIILGLDLDSAEEAVRMARDLAPHVGGFKVGLGLLHGPGPATVGALAELGLPVFADAKLHDIPTQVEAAARRLGRWGARWVTAHVGGGDAMLVAAVSGLADGSGGTAGVLGVTVLTSLDAGALAAIGITSTPGRLVSRMARVAARTGCEGVVCSPQEIGVVADVAPGLLKVIPGIRPVPGETADDQARVATPREAVRRGADWLVIGRPITRAPDPVAAAAAIAADLAEFRGAAVQP